jgi:hypothetical protein
MTSFAELFNPSFFIILGIVTLLVALVVVYFESKMREQNHKFASMLSLVSTLAEDMTGIKAGLNHLAMTTINGGGQYTIPHNTPFPPENLGNTHNRQQSLHLIEVSDDESDDSDDSETEVEEELVDEYESDEEDSENDEEDNEGDTSSESNEEDEPIKVIKLRISDDIEEDNNTYEESNQIDFDNEDDLAILEDIDDIPVISPEYTEEILSLTYNEVEEEQPLVESKIETSVPYASELKTISINLGDNSLTEHIDYKRLQLTKLRSIIVEKGLTSSSEAQKLKKPELLKLLGVE